MNISDINPKDIIFALDIGTRSIIGNVGIVKDKKFNTICEKYLEHEERAMIDGQIHDINLVASTVNSVKKSIEKEIGVTLQDVSIAAAGRFLRTIEVSAEINLEDNKEIDREIIRSLELTAVKKAEEEVNKKTQGKLYCVGYSVKNYYLNGYVISNLLSQKGEKISIEVIATFLPRSVVDSLYSVMNKVGLNVTSLTLEPIAAMEAVVPKKLRLLNIALVDVGAGTSDIAISSNDSISAYGMVPMAGDEVTEAIVQNFLVDFNTAEKIKIATSKGENIEFVDVLGIENEATVEDVEKVIKPVVDKIGEEIGEKIIELNGGRAPNAVFLVGGAAHTPYFKESLGETLGLIEKRIAIKSRDAVIECVGYDESLGSAGVTVLGIALVAIKKSGHDFIDIILNDEVISLFNSHKHKVMDVVLQSGINHKALIGRNGKNIRFVLNDITRVAFGTLATGAEIYVNGESATIDSEVKEGDRIEISFAKDGKDAAPTVKEYFKNINTVSFYLNDKIENIYPIVFINDEKASFDDIIKEGDNVKITFPNTLGEYIKYYNSDEKEDYCYYINNSEVDYSYVIKEGDKVYKTKKYTEDCKESTDIIIKDEKDKQMLIEESKEPTNSKYIENDEEKNLEYNKINNKSENLYKEIHIVVNDEKITLKEREKYVFIDVFNYIDFDLTVSKGNLVLLLNEQKAGYYDELKDGDVIKIFWENI
ncbi:cell division protein FtsA [Clostridium novyi A str. 4570]|uniref:Cell division protein FtsA n=1 Tax=Clostridium novyi A str. 4570 TaxID=1444290 RepID=A0AA88ZM57_CLONO|nr:cell division protein FtsA [Clostridium novyi]KGN02229.1 cell division protein FtsA [Clostridium novyi A str. 4570]